MFGYNYGYNYQSPYQSPLTTQMPQPQPQQNVQTGLTWVQGLSGAKSFMVNPGASVLLMDSESDRFYIKSADAAGMPLPLRIFSYTEIKPNENKIVPESLQTIETIDMNNYITRQEFEKKISELKGEKPDEQLI